MSRSFSDTLQLCPELAVCYEQFHRCIWEQSFVSPVVLELCRLRIAQLLSADLDLSVRYKPISSSLSIKKIKQLNHYHRAEEFTKLERDCIELAECFVLDPATISDEVASSVISQIGDPGYVALLEACGVFEGFTRLRLVLQCDDFDSDYAQEKLLDKTGDVIRKKKFKAIKIRVKAAISGSQSMVRSSPLNLVPETLEAFLNFYQTLWQGSYLRPAELEVGRLRNASLVNCTFCKATRFDVAQDDGLNEQRALAALDDINSLPLQGRDALIVGWTEHFLLNPSTDDGLLDEKMKSEFSGSELAALTIGLSLFMCFSKIAVALGGLPDKLPVMVSPVPC